MFVKNIAHKVFERYARWIAVLVLLLTGIATFGYVAYQPSFALSGIPTSISGPIEPTPTPTPTPPTGNSINWRTNTVSLQAGNFYMVIDGRQYLANSGNVNVRSDPGSPTYTTLEATWQENGVEMRMNMYFTYTPGQFWRLSELRTYNGQNPGEWIMYNPTDTNGNPIQHELGQAYVNAGPLEFRNVADSQYQGLIHFENFRLQAFLPRPTVEGFKRAFGSVRGAPNYDPLYDANNDGRISAVDYSALLTRFAFSGYYLEQNPSSSIVMGIGGVGSLGGGYAIHALPRDAQGNVVTYQQGLTYSWSIDSRAQGGGSPPTTIAIITPFSSCTQGIQPPCPDDHLSIQAVNPGYANIRVSVFRNSDQTEVAQALFNLTVVSEPLVYFNNLSPNGGESFTVGQNITVSWNVAQGTYDYANIYYHYYANGRLLAGFLGAAWYGTNQLSWVIPPELVGKRVRLIVSPMRSGINVGQGISDSYFTVSAQSATVAQSCTFEDLRKTFFSRKGDSRYNSTCDLNKDGMINIRDYSLLRRLRG